MSTAFISKKISSYFHDFTAIIARGSLSSCCRCTTSLVYGPIPTYNVALATRLMECYVQKTSGYPTLSCDDRSNRDEVSRLRSRLSLVEQADSVLRQEAISFKDTVSRQVYLCGGIAFGSFSLGLALLQLDASAANVLVTTAVHLSWILGLHAFVQAFILAFCFYAPRIRLDGLDFTHTERGWLEEAVAFLHNPQSSSFRILWNPYVVISLPSASTMWSSISFAFACVFYISASTFSTTSAATSVPEAEASDAARYARATIYAFTAVAGLASEALMFYTLSGWSRAADEFDIELEDV